MATLTSLELHREHARAKRLATEGPVLITHRGVTTHVMLSAEVYDRLLKVHAGVNKATAEPSK
jgi:PHD/YefM family antitoxin component YafN of YafNO toxin-antitoxin module